MLRPTPPRIEIVKRDDKEEKLVRFVRDCGVPSDALITILARSPASPVVAALAKVLAAQSSSPASLRLILGQTEGVEAIEQLFAAHTVTIRWARHPRLADAHEQLVMGSATWIGDCMRRDPAKRDAFECYAPDCSQSVRWATMAFERLWILSEQIAADRPAVPPAVTADVAALAASLPAAETQEPAPLASTRH